MCYRQTSKGSSAHGNPLAGERRRKLAACGFYGYMECSSNWSMRGADYYHLYVSLFRLQSTQMLNDFVGFKQHMVGNTFKHWRIDRRVQLLPRKAVCLANSARYSSCRRRRMWQRTLSKSPPELRIASLIAARPVREMAVLPKWGHGPSML